MHVNEFTTVISTTEQHGLQPKIGIGSPFGRGKFSRLWRAEHHETNLALTCVNHWFYINHLMLNITKTNVIKFTPKTTAHVPLDIYCKYNVIDEVKSTKFLGMHIENHMNWKNHVKQILPKLSVACFSIRNLIHTLNLGILRMVCFAYFSSVPQNGTIFWENLTNAHQVFKL